MTSANVFKRFTFLAVFIASLGCLQPASALEIAPPAGNGINVYDQFVNQSILNLKGAIIGNGASTGMDVGNEKNVGANGYGSLTEYYDKVWWPRMNALMVKSADQAAGIDALGMSNDGRLFGAASLVGWQQMLKQLIAANNAAFASAADVVCVPESLGQSQFVLDALATLAVEARQQASAAKRSGALSAAGPTSYNGPSEYAYKSVLETNTNGSCVKDGNAGANAKWCTNGMPGDDPSSAYHVIATGILGKTALIVGSDGRVPNNEIYVNMFIARLFPNVFSPIRPDLLNPLSTQAAEVIQQQDAYTAALSVFQYPFDKMIADNTPQADIDAEKYIRMVFERMKVPEDLQKRYLGNNGISKAGVDRVLYKDYLRDVTTMSDNTTWDMPNLLRVLTVQSMNQTSLLYEIREELTTGNAVIGALDSLLTRDQYAQIQAQTSAISTK